MSPDTGKRLFHRYPRTTTWILCVVVMSLLLQIIDLLKG